MATIEIPVPYRFLLEPHRFKVIYGGRNGGKDWSTVHVDILLAMLYDPKYTEADRKAIRLMYWHTYGIKTGLIDRSTKKPHRFLYCREIMTSIRGSVYTTIKDRIIALGLESAWEFKDDRIQCRNGSEFRFAGLYRDPHNIKSTEGITLCRVVEAESVSEDSWKFLVPTIRAPGSEILISFNTRYADDPTYVRWVKDAPKEAVVRKINSQDIEGFLTPEAKANREEDYRVRRYEYDNVWLGEPLAVGRKIYPMFDDQVHLKSFDKVWLKTKANFFMAQDPAQHYYPAALWMAVFYDEGGELTKYIYSEYPKFEDFSDYFHNIRTKIVFNGKTKDLAHAFLLHDGFLEHGFKIRARGIDTRFAKGSGAANFFSNSTDGIVGDFLKQENGGLCFESPDEKIIDVQKAAIIKDLEYDTSNPIGIHNRPHLYIDPSCVNLIQSFKNHRLEEKSESENSRYKDMLDACRILYALQSYYKWEDPSEMEKPKLVYEERYGSRGGPDAWMS